MSKKRSAEEVCIAYATAVATVRSLTTDMQTNLCTNSPDGYTGSCLSAYFSNLKESGQNDTDQEALDEWETMCDACKKRHGAFLNRRDARMKLGAAKRAVESVGRRLQV